MLTVAIAAFDVPGVIGMANNILPSARRSTS